jgi:S-(hydroxymethyl)glutathione dehydrogenase/alcohol dehydrogenase
MSTMKAAVLDAAPGGMRIEEIPIPEPAAGEVLVKVAACGVCHTDLHVMKAEVAFPTPAVMGHEISGTVAALGPGVAGPPVGTRVVSAFIMPCGFCAPCGAGRDDLCDSFFAMNRLKGTLYDGTTRLRRRDGSPIAMYSMAGLAEYSVVPATDVFPLADGLPLEESSVLGCAIFTAYGAVRHGADLRGGERIAVVAAGGVGINIIQVARAFGASQIIAVDVRDDKLAAARRLGATDVVNATAADATARVRELTGGRGVDVAFEVLGIPQTFVQAFEMIRDGGRMVAVGIAPGKTTAAVEITRLVRRELRIVGSYGARTRSDMPEIVRLAAQGIFRPETMVTQRFALDDADAAYQALARGEIVGRAIVVM